MLPLSLLNAAQGQPMLVELKSGESLRGHLLKCDHWMNLTLKEVEEFSASGENTATVSEYYVRGSNIKALQLPDELLHSIKQQYSQQREQRQRQQQMEQSGQFGNRRGNRNYNNQSNNPNQRQRGGGRRY
ncbi:U6 snRNA-associated Sm-like protein LSm4 [Yarrowia sp. B02]|nr:U6 snRNA-associated Sm-like protein LSm4 [Yarrowia sp. B02]